MKSSNLAVLQFLLTPILIITGFGLMEAIFLGFHLGEGKIWGTKNYAGYYKIIPYATAGKRYLYEDFPEHLKAKVNSLGFRGPEFSPRPERGIIRIVTLGDSATFGLHNGESETYPAQLQQYLSRYGHFEVINAGIPMMNILQMKNMLENEIVGYQPAVVTLYSSYNDVIDSTYQHNFVSGLYNFLYKRTEFGVWITKQIKEYLAKNQKAGDSLYPNLSKDEFDTACKSAHDFYFTQVREIRKICEKNGILLVLVKQPTGKPQEYLALDEQFMNLPAGEKAAYYERKLQRQGALNILESKFLIARIVADEINDFTRQERITLVDFARSADDHPEWFVGPVHMNVSGNRALAESIGATVLHAIKERPRGLASQ